MCGNKNFKDIHCHGNTDQVIVKHIDIVWLVDFENTSLSGSATLDCNVLADDVSELCLDSRGLLVSKVYLGEKELSFELKKEKFGEQIVISLDNCFKNKDKIQVKINYSTAKDASAIQWLQPEQTCGKKYPYLFTQNQPVHARSMLPCQDSPGVKFTYTASVTCPEPLVALMSAESSSNKTENAMITYKFKQEVPLPAYLLCLAVGKLESRKLGERSAVWSEAEMVEAAAWEFSDTDKFLCLGEEICGPYEWSRYDVLLLPPSFPYGGMENPRLTFVTPTLLAGDRSLVNVVAHEIAHSWTGNLVTNATWEHFFLNEGFTVFVERKIIGRKDGEAAEHFSALNGLHDLQESIKFFGADNQLTCLNPDLTETDPDDSFSSVPYEKGFNLLFYLQTLAGGPEEFEPYLKAHLQNFAFKTVTTDEWKQFMTEYFAKKGKPNVFDEVDWETWLKVPGMPPITNNFDDTLAQASINLATKWLTTTSAEQYETDFSAADLASFSSPQSVNFLKQLIVSCDKKKIDHAMLKAMDKHYNLTVSKNTEIKLRWHTLCLRSEYEAIVPEVIAFVTSVGRMKFVRPLYRELFAHEFSKELAVETFKKNRGFYHIICSSLVAKDLKIA